MKVAITNIGKCFEVSLKNPNKEDIDNLLSVYDVNLTKTLNNNSKGSISMSIVDSVWEPRIYDYKISKEIIGCFWSEDSMNKSFEIGCKVWQQLNTSKENFKMIYIKGRMSNNAWGERNIVRHFTFFLNKLVQFKCLEDYIAFEEANKEDEWENEDVCDKILELAKVIELYKKYYEINRALSITHEMEELINKRLQSLISNS